MKALHFDGQCRTRIDDVPVPRPEAGELLVRVLYSGVCQTELRYYVGKGAPGVLGHEVVGRIEQIGPNAETTLSVGDAVMLHNSLPCSKCVVCRSGYANVCPYKTGCRGGFAEYMTAGARRFLAIPDDFCTADGTLLYDIFGMMYRGMRTLGIGERSITAIVGLQPYGHGGVTIARQWGARVVGFDASPLRRRIAERLGADMTIDSSGDDLMGRVNNLTGGDLFSEVIECDDPAIPIENLFSWARPGGRLCLMGHTRRTVPFLPGWVTARELTVSGAPRCIPAQYQSVFNLARRCTNRGLIITHTPPLTSEGAKVALDDYVAGKAGKIVFSLA